MVPSRARFATEPDLGRPCPREFVAIIAGYLTSLIEEVGLTDYLREWLARESPMVEECLPADFEGAGVG